MHDSALAWRSSPSSAILNAAPKVRPHLDTVIAFLDDSTIAYYPAAFPTSPSDPLHPLSHAVIATDAADLELNLVSHGRNIVMTDAAPQLAGYLGDAELNPIL